MTVVGVREFWGQRSARERALLACAAAAVVLVALYLFLWQPGLAASRRLSAALPKLRAQVELMRVQQAEIAVLRKSAADALKGGDLRASLEASLARAPFAKSVQRIDAISAERATVAVVSARFEDWLRWVAAAQREAGARLERSSIVALPESGTVRADATFVSVAAAMKP
jgi:type II secretory pathway component PulM